MLTQRHLFTPLEYRADIDGLRAVAVLSVVGFHAFPEWVRGGFVGVDIFFVISGFLISSIIFEGLERGDFSYAGFYARRITRIFPALILVLMASLVLGRLMLTGDEYRQLGSHAMAGAGFVSNFALWSESGYFDNAAATKPLLHLWSLGIEEQFYIFWPLLLGLAFRRKWNFLSLTLLVAFVSFALNIYFLGGHPAAVFYLPLTRFWELMLGGMLAHLKLHKNRQLSLNPRWQSSLGAALIALSLLLLDKEQAFPGWRAMLPDAGAFFIISAGPDAWLNRRLLGSPLLVRIGLISYPLYRWHWPLLSFAEIMTSRVPPISLRVALVLISFLLANATYEKFEKPIRFAKNDRPKVLLLCLYMMAIGYGGYYVFYHSGSNEIRLNSIFRMSSADSLASEKAPDAQALNNYDQILKSHPDYVQTLWTDKNQAERADSCFLHGAQNPFFERWKSGTGSCLVLSSNKENILIIGDSHAADLYVALAGTYKQFNFLELTGGGCAPVSHLYGNDDRCTKLLQYALDFARRNKLKRVILAARWNNGFGSLASDVEDLKSEGLKVILVGPPLEYTADVPPIIARRDSAAGFQRYTESFIVERSIALSNGMKEFAQANNVSFIDRVQYFCKARCPVLDASGQLLILDYGHLSVPGAMYLGNQLQRDHALEKILDSPVPLQLPEDGHLR